MGKLLFYSFLTGFGHFNICLAITREILKKYGNKHEIHFIVSSFYKNKLSIKYPQIKFEVINEQKKEVEEEKFKEEIKKFGETWKIKDKVEFIKSSHNDFYNLINQLKEKYDEITEIIKKVKPNLFLYDHIMTTPIGTDQNIPYVCILSAAPTFLGLDKLPLHQSGLPTEFNEENSKKWKIFEEKAFSCDEFKKVKKFQNDWLKEKNCETVDFNSYMGISPYFNIYNYPSAVDYFNDQVKIPGEWFKLESAITLPIPLPFKIPEKLAKLDGKLIYISMGSFSSAYKPLMERLIKIISQLPHRFILSAGVYCEEYKFSENIYGEKFVDQLAVLQSVDLMISHGGNNTFTECFYFGVPQIIMPLFADQIENATRIKDKGLGETFSPFECTKEDLSNAIEKLTTNEMKDKYKQISTKIQQDKTMDKICEKIVSYCQ